MQTHKDRDYSIEDTQWYKRLQARAEDDVKNKASEITAGKPGEPVLDSYEYKGMHVTRRPADEQGILRISIGGGLSGLASNVCYCVFRGDPAACAALLDEAADALRQRE